MFGTPLSLVANDEMRPRRRQTSGALGATISVEIVLKS